MLQLVEEVRNIIFSYLGLGIIILNQQTEKITVTKNYSYLSSCIKIRFRVCYSMMYIHSTTSTAFIKYDCYSLDRDTFD